MSEIPSQRMRDERSGFAVPLYYQVKELLLERNHEGEWPTSPAMPNETVLADEFGVSFDTMRKVLKRLE